jgi:hypothetical protein
VLQTLLLVAKKRVAFAEVSPLRKMIEGDAVVLKAVMIYQAVPEGTQSGGWYADVVVATHYAGGDLTLGTPVGKPHPTRQEANEDAICILASILATFPRVTTTAE